MSCLLKPTDRLISWVITHLLRSCIPEAADICATCQRCYGVHVTLELLACLCWISSTCLLAKARLAWADMG